MATRPSALAQGAGAFPMQPATGAGCFPRPGCGCFSDAACHWRWMLSSPRVWVLFQCSLPLALDAFLAQGVGAFPMQPATGAGCFRAAAAVRLPRPRITDNAMNIRDGRRVHHDACCLQVVRSIARVDILVVSDVVLCAESAVSVRVRRCCGGAALQHVDATALPLGKEEQRRNTCDRFEKNFVAPLR